jgi:hypothetical protein
MASSEQRSECELGKLLNTGLIFIVTCTTVAGGLASGFWYFEGDPAFLNVASALCGSSAILIGVFLSTIPRRLQREFIENSVLSRWSRFVDRAFFASTRLRHTSLAWVLFGLLMIFFLLKRLQ